MSVGPSVGVAMVGVGGQAVAHLAALRSLQQQGLVRLMAVCEAAPDRWANELAELRLAGVAVEPDLAAMLANWREKVQLVSVPVGIPAHRPVAVQALQAGYHVVLEKPTAGCIDDVGCMLDAAEQSSRTCTVHFQWIWMKSLRAIKAAILGGKIGRLREVRIKGRWFREDRYYTRNAWAGQLRVGEMWVLDGTINNPFAHQVNNALFLAGGRLNDWANPVGVAAELYHARPAISGDDTSCLVVQTDTGADLKLWLTLCSGKPERNPCIRVIGEKGQIFWPADGGADQIRLADGRIERIEPDNTPGCEAVYANACNYVLGRDERILCTLADSRPFTQVISAAYEVAGPPQAVSGDYVARASIGGKEGFVLAGVDEAIEQCFESGRLFGEAGVPWAVPARRRQVGADYRHFRPNWG